MVEIHRKMTRKLKLPLALSITVLVVLLFGSFITGCVQGNASPQSSENNATTTSSNGDLVVPLFDETTTMSLYERVIPGVVEIDTVLESNVSSSIFGNPTGGQGSGFFIDNNGHILTNNHVVRKCQIGKHYFT